MTQTPDRRIITEARLGDALAGFSTPHVQNQRVVAIGDSVTAGGDSNTGPRPYWSGSVYSYLALASKQRFNLVRNAGIGGQTTTQILARFATDVVAHNPGIVVISGGTNDRNGGTMTLAQTKANYAAMVKLARAASIVPVLATVPPTNIAGSGAFNTVDLNRAGVDNLNAWIRKYARLNNIELLDFHRYWVDPVTNGYRTGYSGDGVHPSGTAYAAAITALVTNGGLPALFRGTVDLADSNLDAANLVKNGLGTSDSNADGLPDFWTIPTPSTVNLTDGDAGKWINLTRSTADATIYGNIPTAVTAGDVVTFSGRFKQSANTSATVSLLNTGNYGAVATPIANFTQAITDGVFHMEYVVEAGITSLTFLVSANTVAGTVSVGQVTVNNLTALGLKPTI